MFFISEADFEDNSDVEALRLIDKSVRCHRKWRHMSTTEYCSFARRNWRHRLPRMSASFTSNRICPSTLSVLPSVKRSKSDSELCYVDHTNKRLPNSVDVLNLAEPYNSTLFAIPTACLRATSLSELSSKDVFTDDEDSSLMSVANALTNLTLVESSQELSSSIQQQHADRRDPVESDGAPALRCMRPESDLEARSPLRPVQMCGPGQEDSGVPSEIGCTNWKYHRAAKHRSKIPLVPQHQASSMECSVMSCLHQFTAAELLTGCNRVACKPCSRDKTRRSSGSNGMLVERSHPCLWCCWGFHHILLISANGGHILRSMSGTMV